MNSRVWLLLQNESFFFISSAIIQGIFSELDLIPQIFLFIWNQNQPLIFRIPRKIFKTIQNYGKITG